MCPHRTSHHVWDAERSPLSPFLARKGRYCFINLQSGIQGTIKSTKHTHRESINRFSVYSLIVLKNCNPSNALQKTLLTKKKLPKKLPKKFKLVWIHGTSPGDLSHKLCLVPSCELFVGQVPATKWKYFIGSFTFLPVCLENKSCICLYWGFWSNSRCITNLVGRTPEKKGIEIANEKHS